MPFVVQEHKQSAIQQNTESSRVAWIERYSLLKRFLVLEAPGVDIYRLTYKLANAKTDVTVERAELKKDVTFIQKNGTEIFATVRALLKSGEQIHKIYLDSDCKHEVLEDDEKVSWGKRAVNRKLYVAVAVKVKVITKGARGESSEGEIWLRANVTDKESVVSELLSLFDSSSLNYNDILTSNGAMITRGTQFVETINTEGKPIFLMLLISIQVKIHVFVNGIKQKPMNLGLCYNHARIWEKAINYCTDITEIRAKTNIAGERPFEIKSDRTYLDFQNLAVVYISTDGKREVELIDQDGKKYYVELGRYALGMYIWQVITKAYPSVTQIRTKPNRTGSIYGTVIPHDDRRPYKISDIAPLGISMNQIQNSSPSPDYKYNVPAAANQISVRA
ncbi:hypothetical protein DdX_21738 [Ditylenchus destructor]|uniref:Uncharacterized protein n=1 Tax=Ditylenchus destructor TaxID=166010 RepID=A0AAD4QSW1_9BILA|nr:hypothetical protein DdX_21738 [Ditylenchus destructor]